MMDALALKHVAKWLPGGSDRMEGQASRLMGRQAWSSRRRDKSDPVLTMPLLRAFLTPPRRSTKTIWYRSIGKPPRATVTSIIDFQT